MAEKFKAVPVVQEPKKNNWFVAEFPEEFRIESYLVQSAEKPRLHIDKVEIPYMNTSYISGKHYWEDLTINLIDVIGSSTTQGVMNMINHCKQQRIKFLQEETEGKSDFTKRLLFTFILKGLDPTGVEIERWEIDVQELIAVNFGEFDYASNEIQTIKIVLKPLNCMLL